jgi:hypothetical protein
MTSQRRGLFGLRKKKAVETVMDGATDVSGAGDVLSGAGEVIPAVTTIASEVVPVAAQSWPTTAALMYAMEYFNVAYGCEWWLAIVGATVFHEDSHVSVDCHADEEHGTTAVGKTRNRGLAVQDEGQPATRPRVSDGVLQRAPGRVEKVRR